MTFSSDRSVFLSGTLSIYTTNISDPGANLYSPLTLNFASILVNCSLVRNVIIQTGNANVNENIFAYLYFPVVEMSLVLTFCDEECHSRWPVDTLLAMKVGKRATEGCRGETKTDRLKIKKIRSEVSHWNWDNLKKFLFARQSLLLKLYIFIAWHAVASSSVVGTQLIVMRLIWHGLNNYLPASDWHSHKKGWVGLGSRWWHSTWPNWSISMLGRRCSTGGQHHTIYFTIYGALTHGHQLWHPEGLHAPPSCCAKVDDIRVSHPPCHGTPRKGRGRKAWNNNCNNSLVWKKVV